MPSPFVLVCVCFLAKLWNNCPCNNWFINFLNVGASTSHTDALPRVGRTVYCACSFLQYGTYNSGIEYNHSLRCECSGIFGRNNLAMLEMIWQCCLALKKKNSSKRKWGKIQSNRKNLPAPTQMLSGHPLTMSARSLALFQGQKVFIGARSMRRTR